MVFFKTQKSFSIKEKENFWKKFKFLNFQHLEKFGNNKTFHKFIFPLSKFETIWTFFLTQKAQNLSLDWKNFSLKKFKFVSKFFPTIVSWKCDWKDCFWKFILRKFQIFIDSRNFSVRIWKVFGANFNFFPELELNGTGWLPELYFLGVILRKFQIFIWAEFLKKKKFFAQTFNQRSTKI